MVSRRACDLFENYRLFCVLKMRKRKYCPKCRISKIISDFEDDLSNKSGKRAYCRPCYKHLIDSKIHRETKSCTECKEEKKLEYFNKSERGLYGRESICKKCKLIKNRERYKLRSKYVPPFGYKMCTKCKEEKPLCQFDKGKCPDGLKRECVGCYTPPIPKFKPEEKVLFDKFKKRTRGLISQSFSRACNGTYKKSQRTEEILGCTMEEFKKHIELQFTEGMTWNNHGRCKNGSCEVWHIDHRIPISSANTEERILELCHYSNFQPMWALENISKNNKIL